jgi:hypothetical protein
MRSRFKYLWRKSAEFVDIDVRIKIVAMRNYTPNESRRGKNTLETSGKEEEEDKDTQSKE